MIGGYVLPQLEHLIEGKGTTMNAEHEMSTADGLGADPLPRYPEPVEVELTSWGFQLRHGGEHGSLGGGVWAARWKAQKAAEALRRGDPIPEGLLPDRRI